MVRQVNDEALLDCSEEDLDTDDLANGGKMKEHWADQLEGHGNAKLHRLFLVDGFVTASSGLGRHCRYKVGRCFTSSTDKFNLGGDLAPANGIVVQSVVYRRFSDFCALFQHLVEQQPTALVPMHPQKVPALPLNAVYAMRELCEERIEWCHAFIGAVLRRPQLVRESEWVRHFLFDATEEWQSRLDFCAVQSKERLLAHAKSKVSKLRSALVIPVTWFSTAAAPIETDEVVDSESLVLDNDQQDEDVEYDSSDEHKHDGGSGGGGGGSGGSGGSGGMKKNLPNQLGGSLQALRGWWAKKKENPTSNSDTQFGHVVENGFDPSAPEQLSWEESSKAFCLDQDFEPEWVKLTHAHAQLCSAPEPLQVFAPAPFDHPRSLSWSLWESMGGSGSCQQNVSVKLSRERGRTDALSLVAKGLVSTLKCTQERAGCLASCADAFGQLHLSAENGGEAVEENKFSAALRSALQADKHVLETLKSRHEKETALELVLRAALVAKGGSAALKRCAQLKEALQQAKQESDKLAAQNGNTISHGADASTNPRSEHSTTTMGTEEEQRLYESKVDELRNRFAATAGDFNDVRKEIVQDLSTAALRMANANIKRAQENQRAYKELLELLQSNPEAADQNKVKLGLSSASKAFMWGAATPM